MSPESTARHGFGPRVAFVVGATLCCAVCPALPTESGEPSSPAVARFARLVFSNRFEEAQELMDDTMREAFDRATFEQIPSGLVARLGELRELGLPRFEDRIEPYRRFRVRATFARDTVDLRVVLDGADRVAGFFVVPHLEPPDAVPPAGRELPVEIGAPGAALPGLVELPRGEGPFPGIVLVHGSGASDRDETIGPNRPFRDLSRGLAARGIAVLRYDKRSYARRDDLVAAGDRLTVREEAIDDAQAALRLLREHPGIDAARVYLLGHSLGGTLAPRIAALDPSPAGIVVLAGMTLPLPEKMLAQTRYIVELDGTIDEAEALELARIEREVGTLRAALDGERPAPSGYRLGAPFGYYVDLERHDAPAEAAALGLPVLIVQGSRDYQVTLEDFARWEAAFSEQPSACLQIYAGLDHLLRHGTGPSGPADYDRAAPVAPELIADVATWVHTGACPPADRAGAP